MSNARRALARATRRRRWPRRLPASLGGARLLVSTEAGFKYLKPRLDMLDPVLTGFAEVWIKPGDVVWDIGANVGLFTFCAAGLSGPTVTLSALKPTPG